MREAIIMRTTSWRGQIDQSLGITAISQNADFLACSYWIWTLFKPEPVITALNLSV